MTIKNTFLSLSHSNCTRMSPSSYFIVVSLIGNSKSISSSGSFPYTHILPRFYLWTTLRFILDRPTQNSNSYIRTNIKLKNAPLVLTCFFWLVKLPLFYLNQNFILTKPIIMLQSLVFDDVFLDYLRGHLPFQVLPRYCVSNMLTTLRHNNTRICCESLTYINSTSMHF